MVETFQALNGIFFFPRSEARGKVAQGRVQAEEQGQADLQGQGPAPASGHLGQERKSHRADGGQGGLQKQEVGQHDHFLVPLSLFYFLNNFSS